MDEVISEQALRAAGVLCDFDADCKVRTACLSAAAAVAAGSDGVANMVYHVILCAGRLRASGRDVFGCVMAVCLTLLEGASVQGRLPMGSLEPSMSRASTAGCRMTDGYWNSRILLLFVAAKL